MVEAIDHEAVDGTSDGVEASIDVTGRKHMMIGWWYDDDSDDDDKMMIGWW